MKKIFLLLIIVSITFYDNHVYSKNKVRKSEKFSFVFMTDIHVSRENRADEGFLKAINTIDQLKPDFVISGGDNILDALGQSYGRADSLYNLYTDIVGRLKMPVYSTMGNHEVFGLYKKSGVSPTHPEYGKKLYEHRIAKRYYSFDFKNWHFIVLDGIGFTPDRRYYGFIDAEQVEWLKNDLQKTGTKKPVAISTHIPLLSVGRQIMSGPTEAFEKGSIITNAHEIIQLIEKYNVKLVLQGHLHFLEDINYNGIHYITGGAVSSGWWKGPRFGMEEGFLKIDVAGQEFKWNYVDFGWEVKKNE